MRKLMLLLFLALAVMSFRTAANTNIFISDETLWSEFYYFYQQLKADCPVDTAPNNWGIYGTGTDILVTIGSLTCDNCIVSDCEYGEPWSGRYNGGAGTSAPPPPSPLEPPPSSGDSLAQLSNSFYDPDWRGFDVDGNIRGSLGTNVFGNWDIVSGDRRDWRDVTDFSYHGDVTQDAWALNYFMKLNLQDQTDTVIDAVGISTNLTARRLAYMSDLIERSSAHNDLLHAYTVSSSAAHAAEAADYVVGQLSNIADYDDEFSDIQSTLDYVIDKDGFLTEIGYTVEGAVMTPYYWLDDRLFDVQTRVNALGPQLGSMQGSIASQLNNVQSSVNNYTQSQTAMLSGKADSLLNQSGQILSAIQGLESGGGSGGGISEEFAAGLVGDYTGDDYNDSEAEGLLGTEGLTIDDLDGETVSLDSLSENFFSFAPVQCFEPLTLNFSVFGAENIIEIDLTPLCTLFNLVGALLFIASNLLAVRVVVGAF